MIRSLCMLAVLALASASDVVELGDSNFQDRLDGMELALVKFYAPWCGHCKKIAPEFDKAATPLLNNDPPIYLVKVDCTADGKDVCSKYGVSGYPTLKAFKNGEMAFDYNGPREADGIMKYMRSKAGPTAKDLSDVAAAEKFVSSDDHVVVGFFEDSSSDFASQFKKLADALNEEFRFGYSSDKAVMEKLGHKDEAVLYRPKKMASKFEDTEVVFTGDKTLAKLKSWVKDDALGLCGQRTSGNQANFHGNLVVAYYDVDYVRNAKGTNYWRNRVMKVGKKLKEAGRQVTFAISNTEEFNHELSEFGVTSPTGDKPVVAGKSSTGDKYVMTEEFSMDAFEKFVEDMLDGKLEKYLKSEDVPDNSNEDVKVAVAKNFDELVNNEEKDVLIEFYAPWCGHCKSLAPIYEELAKKLKDEPEITIVKMDATANDVQPQYQVQGFPTLYFAPRGSKSNPKKYEGGREVDEFIKYLAKESTNPLLGYDRSGKKKKQKTEL